MPHPRRTLAETFQKLRQERRIGLLPFVPAGYPDLATTERVIAAIDQAGAAAIEIGIPFSDPIADGPIIQEAFNVALGKGLKVGDVLSAVRRVRDSVSCPLLAMVSYSLVYRYGAARFFADAKASGLDGLILPDLPLPEADAICQQVRSAGLDTVLLVAPTTPADRRKEIAQRCSGFVYYMSISGITGQRDSLPPDLQKNLQEMRALTQTPVCVGFGISTAEHVSQLQGLADGAIVGSALVKEITRHLAKGADGIALAAAQYCRGLMAKIS